MYHALVRKELTWVSFGVHVPTEEWSDIFKTLRRAYGRENVAYVFWGYDDPFERVGDVESRIKKDVTDANRVQGLWDQGTIDIAEADGSPNIAAGIAILRETAKVAAR